MGFGEVTGTSKPHAAEAWYLNHNQCIGDKLTSILEITEE